jgi:hypothetical protein
MITNPVSEKLAKHNHMTWKAQVTATMRGARLEGYLTGKTVKPTVEINDKDGDKVSNPAYEDWLASDQQVLSFLLSSVSKEILAQIGTKQSAAEAWTIIETMFMSKTRARAVNTRLALATAQKGSSTVTEYVAKMRALGDEMAAAGRPLEDEELVEYILTGLADEYDSVVSSIFARSEPVSVSELYSQLLAFETRLDLRSNHNNSLDLWPMLQIGVVMEVLAGLDAVLMEEGTQTLQPSMVAGAIIHPATTFGKEAATCAGTPTTATPMIALYARCASRQDTRLTDAGTGMMKIMFLKSSMQLLL